MAHVAYLKGFQSSLDAIIPSGWYLTVLFIFLAPVIGMLLSIGLMMLVYWCFQSVSPG